MTLRRFATRTLAAAVTVAGLTIAAVAIPTSSPRDRAVGWAKSLSPADRQMYIGPDKLAGLPVEYRKALFATLQTPEERISFWQNVFTSYRRQHTLTLTQESALTDAEKMISVMFTVLPAQRAGQEAALRHVSDEIKRVLGPQAHRELFLSAGPDGRTDSLAFAERAMVHAATWSHTNRIGRAAARVAPSLLAIPPDCNCNASQDDCYNHQTCTGGLNGCEQDGGCACDWIIFNCWTCDGICNYPLD